MAPSSTTARNGLRAPLRVAVVSETLSRGGLETRVLGQARRLVERGHQVAFITASQDVPAEFEALGPVLAGRGVGQQCTAFQLSTEVDALAEWASGWGATVVHSHPFASQLGAGLLAAALDLPLHMTLHGRRRWGARRCTTCW